MKTVLSTFFLITMISITVVYSQDERGSFEFEGRTRTYFVYLPQNFQSNMPVVLNLHGHTFSATGHSDMTLMHEFADTSGFIVAYPQGSSFDGLSGWNNGLRQHGPTDTTSNDVGFISALIDTLDLSRLK